jgi:transcriptional regulator with XRE-family HTH domain
MKHANIHLVENLKRFREEKKLTQEEMAKLLHYSVYGYRKIEQGQRGLPIHKALRAAEILGCSLDDIFLR